MTAPPTMLNDRTALTAHVAAALMNPVDVRIVIGVGDGLAHTWPGMARAYVRAAQALITAAIDEERREGR